ncbi:MAG TPA: FAD-dependent monooxygenase, partial [Flavobacteriales bacterium]|nr:FAD-dependent monooxygenase [Flavobacteriales bacterium]
LMLAGELALAGIDVVIIERRPSQELAGRRAGGLLARTIEVLDQRGVAERFISQGKKHEATMFAGTSFVKDLPTRHNYVLELRQNQIERILAGWVHELKVPIRYGMEVTRFQQDDAGVDVQLSDGTSMRTQYLVGCDGGRSLIRKTAGIDFPGWDPTTSNIIAEAELTEEPTTWGIKRDARGIHALSRLDDGKRVGILVTESQVGANREPTLDELSEAMIAAYGSDFGVHNPTWLSRFTDAARQATTYRKGRVFLAGDAAHIHPPDGGQGIQTGLQDAVNLGWKLAQVIKGVSPDSMLDTYHAERHPVAARVLRTNMAQVMLRRPDERTQALRDTITELLAMDEPSRKFAVLMFGLDIHYDLGEGHPLLGRRMPDLDLITANGALRVFTLLQAARPVLINFGERGGIDITPWAGRVQLIDAKYDGAWEDPAIGAVPAPTAVLIRPDGYVAWVGDGGQEGLADALTKWFGAPSEV